VRERYKEERILKSSRVQEKERWRRDR